MKNQALNLLAVLLLSFSNAIMAKGDLPNHKIKKNVTIAFTENKGQVHDQFNQPRPEVKYGLMTGNMAVHIKTSGVSYQLYQHLETYKSSFSPETNLKKELQQPDQIKIYRIDLNWVNANLNSKWEHDLPLPGHTNYYLENCDEEATNVKSYEGITLHNLYDGINLHYYEKNGELKHDYIVKPHSNYKQIKVKVEGAEIALNKDGSLILKSPLGNVQEGAPIVYQNGRQLKARWVINENILSFEIEQYNANQDLIIDPITRLWGTYYGGTGNDVTQAVVTDGSGNVYMSGWTTSNTSSVIATSGAHQSTISGGSDAVLIKFDTDGVRQWATYYGGTGSEEARGCTVDAGNNVYLTGITTSTSTGNPIATNGSHQTLNGGGNDAFLVKFNSNGIRQWGTYYGGTGLDTGYGCVTDNSNNVYVAGFTRSSNAIATSGGHQFGYGGGTGFDGDAFLVKFNSNGVRQWGTYYGDTGNDIAYSCAIDAIGDVYLAGFTASTNSVLATVASHQSVFGGGSGDAFLVKFNTTGTRLWATFYGGSGGDGASSCATSTNGNVYLAGTTNASSGTVIATVAGHQTVSGGSGDCFLVKFDASGVRQWGTFYGGGANDEFANCVTDALDNVYLSGTTSSTNTGVIATNGSHQTVNGGGKDGFLAIFNGSGIRQWGTYYGGAWDENNYSCTVDLIGNMYLTGSTLTYTGSAIATPGSHQPTLAVSSINVDAYLVKFRDCDILNPLAFGTTSVCSGASINLSVSISGTAMPNYKWTGPNSFTSAIQNPSISNASTVNVGVYTVSINNVGCIETATTLVASANPTITVNSGSICLGNTFAIIPAGASTYTITGGSFVVSPNLTSTYSVTGTSSTGCISGNTALLTVTVNPLPVVSVNSGSICLGSSFVVTPGGASTYTITGGSLVVSPNATSSYSVTGTSSAGCVSANTAIATVTVNSLPTVSVNSGSICSGNNFVLVPSGAITYSITGGSFTVSPTITSTYSVIGTNSIGCVSGTAALATVTVMPLPVITVSTSVPLMCVGETSTLNAGGASSYTFIPGGQANQIVISPTISSNYTVSGIGTNGCVNTSVFTQNVDLCSSVKNDQANIKSASVLIYPNPTNGIINIESEFDNGILILNSLGQVVYSAKTSLGVHQADLNHLSKGVYILRVENEQHSNQIKFIKE